MPTTFCDQLMDDRDLSRFRTKACQRHILGCCEFQIRCQYSHTSLRRCPFLLLKKEPLTILRYLPMYCDYTSRTSNSDFCPRGNGCPFAHSEEEVLYHPLMYKQKLCSVYHNQRTERSSGDPSKLKESSHDISTRCPKFYCPFIHKLREKRLIQTSTYFLAPSFVKKVVLHLPNPLSSIPVSMLSTGKLTELKSIPDDLLESLLVSRVNPMKPSMLDSNSSGTSIMLLDKNQLQSGSLCLVGVPFGVTDIMTDENDENDHPNNNNRVGIHQNLGSLDLHVPMGLQSERSREQTNEELTAATMKNSVLSQSIQYLNLLPGDMVELLGHFPIAQTQDLSKIYFYGRMATGDLKCQEGWFPSSILIGVEESDANYYDVSLTQQRFPSSFTLMGNSDDEVSAELLMMMKLQQRNFTSTNMLEQAGVVTDQKASFRALAETNNIQQYPTITTTVESLNSKSSSAIMMPILQQLCSELESCLVIELIQGMTKIEATDDGLDGTLSNHLMLDADQCHQLVLILNRLHVALNHLETITTIRRRSMKCNENRSITITTTSNNNNENDDDDGNNIQNRTPTTKKTDRLIERETTNSNNNNSNIAVPTMMGSSSNNNKSLLDYDLVVASNYGPPSNHRLSAASTYSGCGGVDDDDNDDEHEGIHWDTDWDMAVLQLGRNTCTTGS